MGLKLGITMLIHNKDDIQFVTDFLYFGTWVFFKPGCFAEFKTNYIDIKIFKNDRFTHILRNMTFDKYSYF